MVTARDRRCSIPLGHYDKVATAGYMRVLCSIDWANHRKDRPSSGRFGEPWILSGGVVGCGEIPSVQLLATSLQ
jgi:hypothetical protein